MLLTNIPRPFCPFTFGHSCSLQPKISHSHARSILYCNLRTEKVFFFFVQFYSFDQCLHLQDKSVSPILTSQCPTSMLNFACVLVWVPNKETKLVFYSVPQVNNEKTVGKLFLLLPYFLTISFHHLVQFSFTF